MFKKFIEFFIRNHRLNYFLFFAIFIAGIRTYNMTPKELFPNMEIDKIKITGSYPGTSIENLNKMAVIDLEDDIKSIEGIKNIDTIVKSGNFEIVAEINDGYDKYKLLDDVKDKISINKSNLPSDMKEPNATIIKRVVPLMDISLSSSTKNKEELIEQANIIKSDFLKIPNVSDVIIFGDSDKHILFKLKNEEIKNFNLNINNVINVLKQSSYIFPIGTIEEKNNENYFITSLNGKKDVNDIKNTLINIDGKKLYISDIAEVEKKLKDSTNLSTLNANNSLMLRIIKSDNGNTIEISDFLNKKVKEFNKNLNGVFELEVFTDTSKVIKDRLDTVVSNILLGSLLVTFSLFLLINKRISIVVGMGIPTAFLIGSIFFYYSGNTINMISLLGVLIAIGILVDDAIIVSENIQRLIEQGYNKIEASIKGTSEVALPITISAITTLFAFIPMLTMSGDIGKFIMMIPIAIILLIIASLIESFIFLPIHSAHILDKKDKERSWKKVNKKYKESLNFFIKWKKTFITIFIIIVPLLTVIGLKNTKFQFFPQYDSNNIYISGKLNLDNELEDTFEILKKVENKILENKKEFFIKNTTGKAGFRITREKNMEFSSNLLYITIELEESAPDNFVDKYVNPLFSFYYDDTNKIRTISSLEISKKLEVILKDFKINNKNVIELDVEQDKPGIVKSDIQLNIKSNNIDDTFYAINILKDKLSKINGIKDINDNASFGNKEIKIKINKFGESLGFTENYVSSILSDNFLGNKKNSFFDDDGIFDIVIENKDKNKIDTLNNFLINIPNSNKKVNLNYITEYIYLNTFEKMEKENGTSLKSVFRNVNPDIITATEVIDLINDDINLLKNKNIDIDIKGEMEKKAQLMNDVLKSFAISIILILLALLFMFNSFKVSFMIISVIPFSFLGVLIGHFIMGMNLSMPSIIGALGLAGIVINDGIVMLDFLEKSNNKIDMLEKASQRLRPIVLTSLTTFIGLITLMFYASGQAVTMQPLAISLGFGLLWGTILNLFYVPVLYSLIKKYHKEPHSIDLSRA